jgi:hypothetical protein
MDLAAAMCPHFTFAVNKAARVMDRPVKKDWNKVIHIVRYLRSTSNNGLRYTRGSGELNIFL